MSKENVKLAVGEAAVAEAAAPIAKSVWQRILPYLIGGTATAGTMDTVAYNGDYSNITPGRVANTGLNFLLGALGGKQIAKGNIVPGMTEISLAPMKDFYMKGTSALDDTQRALRTFTDKMEQQPSITGGMSPMEKILAGTAVVGSAALLVPALINIARASNRLAEGRAIRLSTSIRKRPMQESDLTIGIKNLGSQTPEEAAAAAEAAAQAQKPKGFFGSLFGG